MQTKPTVTLSQQYYETLQTDLPAINIDTLSDDIAPWLHEALQDSYQLAIASNQDDDVICPIDSCYNAAGAYADLMANSVAGEYWQAIENYIEETMQ